MRWLLSVLLVLLVIAPAAAQPPASCEDQVRALRILAEQYAASRQRTEIEAAQTMAGLLKRIDALQAEVGRLKAPKPEPPKEPTTP